MKITFMGVAVLLAFSLYACRGNINPVEVNLSRPLPGYCSILGLDIEFADTCSYDFVAKFFSGFDSVEIKSTLLGGAVYVHANSGDFNYWYQYFEEDSAVQYITASHTYSNALILKLMLTGKRSLNEEEEILSQIKYLRIINFEQTSKLVEINEPENNFTYWADNFRKYPFILQVLAIGVCFN